MDEAQARKRCEELAAAAEDRSAHSWIPRRQSDGSWVVAKVAVPPPDGPKVIREGREPAPSIARDDPRSSLEQRIPPYGAGPQGLLLAAPWQRSSDHERSVGGSAISLRSESDANRDNAPGTHRMMFDLLSTLHTWFGFKAKLGLCLGFVAFQAALVFASAYGDQLGLNSPIVQLVIVFAGVASAIVLGASTSWAWSILLLTAPLPVDWLLPTGEGEMSATTDTTASSLPVVWLPVVLIMYPPTWYFGFGMSKTRQ